MCLLLISSFSVNASPLPDILEVLGLEVTVVQSPPADDSLKIAQPFGRRGPTSIRYRKIDGGSEMSRSPNPTDPNGGYFHPRDRDLGQTFTIPSDAKPFRLHAVTLRVGPVAADFDGSLEDARLHGRVFLQIFEVLGQPVLNDNGTTGDVLTSEAYPNRGTKAMADDYFTGETYTSLLVACGGKLAGEFQLGSPNSGGPEAASKGSLLRFGLEKTGGVLMLPGRTYAFLVGFEKPGATMALPLDNWDYLNTEGATREQIQNGPYVGGHAIRREGRVPEPWNHLNQAFSNDSVFARFPENRRERLSQQPSTWGRPDVDTYRDLVFWIEGDNIE